MIENSDADQIERLNSRIIELLRERDALVKALHRLTNEVRGIFDAFEYGIRQEINNTNFAVVFEKLEEASRALASIKRTS